jgi:hypothetical protein
LEILKAKYSRALVDVIPTDRAQMYLWGDRLSAPEICDEARRKLREDARPPFLPIPKIRFIPSL